MKGFTLVELLAVIVLLALLTLFTTTTVTRQVKNGKKEVYEQQLQTIKLSAEMWGSEHKNTLSNYQECVSITLGYLKEEGYIDKNIKNALTDELFNDDEVFVNIIPKNKGYQYQVFDDDTKICSIVDFE